MRIAYVSPVAAMGGAEQCLLNVMASVRATAPQTEVHLIVAADGPLVERCAAVGAHIHILPMPVSMATLGNSILQRQKRVAAMAGLAGRALKILPDTRQYVSRLRQALHRVAPHVIHSNGLKTHLLTSLANAQGSSLIWHVHDFLGMRPAMGRALRLASRRAAGAIAISQAVARDIKSILPHLPVEVVLNAINVDHFTPSDQDLAVGEQNGQAGAILDELAHLPPPPPGTVRAGLVAAFARWKGQDLLLEAAARFVKEHPEIPIRFYIIGGPIYKTQGSQFSEAMLREQAGRLELGDRVGFIGFQPDTRPIYRALDIVIHASTQPEPFGLTIIEAMACGRPVIVSSAGGAAELFTEGVDAIGIPPGDAAAMATAIYRLATDTPLRTRVSQQAYRTAVSRFSRDRLGGEMLAVYGRFRR